MRKPICCTACGLDLTPTPAQMRALERFGNPLRRPPCLETENGLHEVDPASFAALPVQTELRMPPQPFYSLREGETAVEVRPQPDAVGGIVFALRTEDRRTLAVKLVWDEDLAAVVQAGGEVVMEALLDRDDEGRLQAAAHLRTCPPDGPFRAGPSPEPKEMVKRRYERG